MLLEQHETEHLPMSRLPQAVCTGWYIISSKNNQIVKHQRGLQDFSALPKVTHIFLEAEREKWGMYVKYQRHGAGLCLCRSGSPFPCLGMTAKGAQAMLCALAGGKEMYVLKLQHGRFMGC